MDLIIDLLSRADLASFNRLFVAAFLGGIVGFERERSGKVAGLRTHTMVALGAALLSLLSIRLFEDFPSVNGSVGFDYHLIANVIVGIGFIGAGTILKRENKIEGTTTAASLWVVAAVGLTSGMGYYGEAIMTTFIAYVVLAGLWLIEKYLTKELRYRGEGIFGELKNSNHHIDSDSEK
ncbi:MAG: MgtC/SapB family protein [Candidatus Yanofskybacteria bacterium]|nr:MgtC/SapB family protein [Candidatus Yanofskybacteria bacterium]